ncbi:MAG: preprotein translocase subunit SecY [Deltaproteobacteria bacterium RBG_13_52_11]|nr:MAG: preprotein translocase subunit SecY [Deltaproteobacteria bacterium RBG_13_52_11]
MMTAIGNIFKIPELKRRITITLLLLAVYRIGCHIPTPGIDSAALTSFFEQAGGTLLGFFDMFAGGAMKRLSVFALGIMPYISSSIILQLLTVVVPYLERLQKEGEMGRRKIVQYTRYGTVILSIIQGFGIAMWMEAQHGMEGAPIALHPGWSFRLMTTITLAAGTSFLMWLGEQITERGIGNGISLIIFAGIVASMPAAIVQTSQLIKTGELGPILMLGIVALMVAVIAFIVYMETSHRRIPVQYAKRIIGRRMYGGQTTHLPLKINTAGVIPPIFASSILMFPATIANFVNHPWMQKIQNFLQPTTLTYNLLFVGFIIFFCYFYTAVVFNPVDVAENMKKYGGFIPGIRPGSSTADYIDRVLTRITLGGAIYVAGVCVLPTFLYARFNVPFYFGGTALLIVVGVALDTVQQIESHMLTRHYEGLISGGRIKGRRG